MGLCNSCLSKTICKKKKLKSKKDIEASNEFFKMGNVKREEMGESHILRLSKIKRNFFLKYNKTNIGENPYYQNCFLMGVGIVGKFPPFGYITCIFAHGQNRTDCISNEQNVF